MPEITLYERIVAEGTEKVVRGFVDAKIQVIFQCGDGEVEKLVREQIAVIVKTDPDVKAKLKEKFLEYLDNPPKSRW